MRRFVATKFIAVGLEILLNTELAIRCLHLFFNQKQRVRDSKTICTEQLA